MLVLTRRIGEEIVIAGDIRVTVVAIHGQKVRLAIRAAPAIRILRGELIRPDANVSAARDGREQSTSPPTTA
ncbi:MAG TPA: carbon storage regulator [Gemmataceae bacterium]|nr:carbon storage regulator [Gemmataceae bacterium]